MLRTVIIDDDQVGSAVLSQLLQDHFDDVELVGKAESLDAGVKLVRQVEPELVFLDIELNGHNGFDVLKSTRRVPFEVVVCSNHECYALQAYRLNAIDYLLKPVYVGDLFNAIKKVRERQEMDSLSAEVEALTKELRNVTHGQFERIKVATGNGFRLLELRQIIRIEADRNYSKILLTCGESLITSQTLKSFEEQLKNNYFCRIHKSHLVNLRHVRAYHRTDCGGGEVEMTNGLDLHVSKRKKELLLRSLPHNGQKY